MPRRRRHLVDATRDSAVSGAMRDGSAASTVPLRDLVARSVGVARRGPRRRRSDTEFHVLSFLALVRGNGGGTTPQQLLAALMNRPWRTWQETSPQHIVLREARGVPPLDASRASRPQPPSADAYAGRVVVLVDRFCVSACEDFVMPFKDTGRGTLVGETTQGSSGNPYRVALGSGMNVRVGAIQYRFPDGAPFEGVGIVPDVAVERRRADVAAGRDAVLARAEALAGALP